MPLLLWLGLPPHMAVGTALFDSMFIALPASLIYLNQAVPSLGLLGLCGLTHAAGVLIGSCTATAVPAAALKKGVGLFSVAIALFMLLGK